MRMRITSVFAAAVAVFGLALAASAQTTPPPGAATPAPPTAAMSGPSWEGIFGFGGSGWSTDGNQDRVAEYQVTDQDALASLRALAWGEKNGFRYDLTAISGGDARNQNYAGFVDFNRILKAHVTYRSLPHQLDHDPLDYVDGGSGTGGTFIVRHDDTDPTANYEMRYGTLEAGVDLNFKNVTFFLGHERQTRGGSHQVMTVAHCANCHTVAFTKQYEELTRTLSAGARLTLSALTLEYAFTNRDYEDAGANPLYQFDDAVQPATLQDIFLNRVQYDDANGLLPVSSDPSTHKFSNTVKGRLAIGDASLTGNFTQSRTENTDQNLAYDYTGGFSRLFVPIGQKMSIRGDFRRYSIDNDSVFVNVVEQTTPAGLSAGLTYPQAFPNDFPTTFDFVRDSSLNRTPTEFGLELGVQPAKRTFLRFGYGWQALEREFYEVDKTVTNTVYVAGRSTLGKKANTRFRVQFEDTKDPFLHHQAAIPAVLQPSMSPGNSPLTGLQYYTMYEARQADLTSFPSRNLFVEGMITATPTERLAITGHYRWRDSENDELNYSQWGRTAYSPGVDVWYRGRRQVGTDGRRRLSEGDARYAVQHARFCWLSGRHHGGPVWLPHRHGRLRQRHHQRLVWRPDLSHTARRGVRQPRMESLGRDHHGLRLRRWRIQRTARRSRLRAAIVHDGQLLRHPVHARRRERRHELQGVQPARRQCDARLQQVRRPGAVPVQRHRAVSAGVRWRDLAVLVRSLPARRSRGRAHETALLHLSSGATDPGAGIGFSYRGDRETSAGAEGGLIGAVDDYPPFSLQWAVDRQGRPIG